MLSSYSSLQYVFRCIATVSIHTKGIEIRFVEPHDIAAHGSNVHLIDFESNQLLILSILVITLVFFVMVLIK